MAADAPPPAVATVSRRRRHRLLWSGAGVVVLAGLIVGGLTFGRDPPRPSGGGEARAIDLPRLDGPGTVSLAALRGQPVVVNFFASWCVPCRKEMPALQAVSERVQGRIAFLGVDHQDDRKGALQLLGDTGVRYPSGYDPDGTVARSYGLFGMPTTLFIDAEGNLLETHTGGITEQQLEDELARLFPA